jgi:hypothetical protein
MPGTCPVHLIFLDLITIATFNWVMKRMTWRNAIERWETKISNSEVTPHATFYLGSMQMVGCMIAQ